MNSDEIFNTTMIAPSTQVSLEELAEAFVDGVFILDLEGTFTFVNTVIVKRSGIAKARLIGLPCQKLVTPEYQASVKRNIDKALKGETVPPFEFSYKSPDGHVIFLELNTKPIHENGVIKGLFGISRDITERKRTEERLRQSNKRFRDIAENALEWIWEIDTKGIITYTNPAVTKLLGFSQEEVMSRSFFDFFYPDEYEKLKKLALEIIEERKDFRKFISKNIHKNGSVVWLMKKAIPINSKNGELLGYRGVDTDITEQKLSEEKMLASLQEKNILLKEIHHRVKNNLQIISSLLKLQSYQVNDPEILEKFHQCQSRIQAMAIIHTKLFQSDNFIMINFREYVNSLLEYLFESYGINKHRIKLVNKIESLEMDLDKAIPCGLLFNELVTNSLKHGFPEESEGEILISLSLNSDNIYTLEVVDNGIGIPQKNIYLDSKNLGITLIKTLTKQLDGELKFSNSKGTAVSISFPVSE